MAKVIRIVRKEWSPRQTSGYLEKYEQILVSVENANKLIRQYVPKGVSFKDYPPERIKQIQHKLNNRPREKIGFSSSKVEFYKQFQ
ncbi:MAG: hypothetical protein PHG06_05485 [Parabacteroides sp.]|jgi:IS30 family transposase|nr:hypothetical protein [Parabacteroides sp.]